MRHEYYQDAMSSGFMLYLFFFLGSIKVSSRASKIGFVYTSVPRRLYRFKFKFPKGNKRIPKNQTRNKKTPFTASFARSEVSHQMFLPVLLRGRRFKLKRMAVSRLQRQRGSWHINKKKLTKRTTSAAKWL